MQKSQGRLKPAPGCFFFLTKACSHFPLSLTLAAILTQLGHQLLISVKHGEYTHWWGGVQLEIRMAKQKEVGRVVRVYRIIAMYIKYHGVYCATVSISKTRVGYLWLTREESPPSPFLLPDSEESLQSDFQPKLLLGDDDEEEHTWSWCEWTILVTKCIFFLVKPWQRRKQMRQQRKQWQRPTSCWFPSERRKALFFSSWKYLI